MNLDEEAYLFSRRNLIVEAPLETIVGILFFEFVLFRDARSAHWLSECASAMEYLI